MPPEYSPGRVASLVLHGKRTKKVFTNYDTFTDLRSIFRAEEYIYVLKNQF
jgi:hypothetical protein